MPLYFFYTMVQKVKNDQKLKSRGSCLKMYESCSSALPWFSHWWSFLHVAFSCYTAVVNNELGHERYRKNGEIKHMYLGGNEQKKGGERFPPTHNAIPAVYLRSGLLANLAIERRNLVLRELPLKIRQQNTAESGTDVLRRLPFLTDLKISPNPTHNVLPLWESKTRN